MDSDYSLPPEFLAALERRAAEQAADREAEMNARVGQLIDDARDNVTAEIQRLQGEYSKQMERLVTRRARSLRAQGTAAEKKLEAVRLTRLERCVREGLERFRAGETYGDYLLGLVEHCREAGFQGRGVIQAEPLEAQLLGELMPDCEIVTKELGRWGGSF